MAELSYIFKQNFSYSFDTLKNTSYDKENKIYLCNSNISVINFDKIAKKLYPHKNPSSYDSLIIEENIKKVFFIEFKNQKRSDISRQNIHKKIKSSDDTLKDICKKHNVKKDNYSYTLCVVYKQTNSQYEYRRFEKNIIHFEIEQYIPKYCDNIITNDILFFKKEFKKKYRCK
jgi:hypothetical protein